MEALNQAESTIYQTEKTLEEVGDKASQEEKDAVNSAVSDLKAVIANENASGDEIRKAIDEVMNKFHVISQKMYEQAQAEAQAQQGAEQQSQAGDDVVDADYEVVDEDK